MAKVLMVQGTGSDVGKSLIVAGLCRALVHRGWRVAPFKPQNMSNNAAVTREGGEIGRAQALQARAARLESSVHMNPVLLKPQSEIGAQIIVQGRMQGEARAADYQAMKPKLMGAVIDSFAQLCDTADFVLVEGAGSAAEVNLRENDLANMGFAEKVGAPVILVGDIDRGGVIASLVGTKVVLPAADAARIVGFIVNRFRGDSALFAAGMTRIAAETGWRALGLLPHFAQAAMLPAEDRLGLTGSAKAERARVRIVVPVLPMISNFDDLDPLRLEPGVEIVLVEPGTALPGDADLVILPGSKSTIADLAAFRAAGWDIDLIAHLRRGGQVLGLCGGFQMLGRKIADPLGIEGPPGEVTGLGLLEVCTRMTPKKALRRVRGAALEDGAALDAYEMHIGETTGPACAAPLHRLADGRLDGAKSSDGRVAGTYLHGLFNADAMRRHWLGRIGARSSDLAYEAKIESVLDALALHLETHLDMNALIDCARAPNIA